jgi:4-oxalocrotonate tautomerase
LLVPIVRIDIQAGKSTAYKREILHAVRSAITESLGVPDERVMQRLIETPAENIDTSDARTDRLTIVEVSMLPGRDASLKQRMYAAMVAHLGEKPGIHQQDITVLVHDPSAECFAIGGVMQCTLPAEPEPSEDEDEEEVSAPALAAEPLAPEAAPVTEANPEA